MVYFMGEISCPIHTSLDPIPFPRWLEFLRAKLSAGCRSAFYSATV